MEFVLSAARTDQVARHEVQSNARIIFWWNMIFPDVIAADAAEMLIEPIGEQRKSCSSIFAQP